LARVVGCCSLIGVLERADGLVWRRIRPQAQCQLTAWIMGCF